MRFVVGITGGIASVSYTHLDVYKRQLSILWKKPAGCEYEIILINQKLGY